MRDGPVGATDCRFANGLVVFAFNLDGYGQPLRAQRSLDLIAIAPVSPRVLHIIV